MTTREDIVSSIGECLRAGAAYHHCDGDGYHDKVTYRDGRYVHIDGFRSISNSPTPLTDEHGAVALICALHPRSSTESESESESDLLQSILATLEAQRP